MNQLIFASKPIPYLDLPATPIQIDDGDQTRRPGEELAAKVRHTGPVRLALRTRSPPRDPECQNLIHFGNSPVPPSGRIEQSRRLPLLPPFCVRASGNVYFRRRTFSCDWPFGAGIHPFFPVHVPVSEGAPARAVVSAGREAPPIPSTLT